MGRARAALGIRVRQEAVSITRRDHGAAKPVTAEMLRTGGHSRRIERLDVADACGRRRPLPKGTLRAKRVVRCRRKKPARSDGGFAEIHVQGHGAVSHADQPVGRAAGAAQS